MAQAQFFPPILCKKQDMLDIFKSLQ